MALPQRGKSVGGDFLDFKELFSENSDRPYLVVCRIREYQEPEPGDYGAYKVPVIADVMICSGGHAGEVHLGERIIGAPTGPLRGVKNPKKDERPPFPAPVNPVGAELVFRVSVNSPKGSNPFVAFDEPSDPEYDAVLAVHSPGGVEGAGWDAGSALAATGTDGAPVPAAAATGGTKKPWG